ncbi:MAG: gliding motility-associated C-terminal domain-containing protein [Microscillaceae bacterium]|nr:gliding motility-associated C-terminal domain-containing protein [Microscillaceae bacterium]MDW8459818.1 gliding motility-associated C-terminal domain-containing protein [Cytophagales bacterium]
MKPLDYPTIAKACFWWVAFTFYLFWVSSLGTVEVKAQHQIPPCQVRAPGLPHRPIRPENLTALGDKLIFKGFRLGRGFEPFVSSTCSADTLRDLAIGVNSSNPSSFVVFNQGGNNYIYFSADGQCSEPGCDNPSNLLSNSDLWRTDGTYAGTIRIKRINPGASATSGMVSLITVVGNKLFFRANGQVPSATGVELWVSDGTSAGTNLVKDIRPGPPGSDPQHLTSVFIGTSHKLFFTADDGTHGRELWVSDGTAAGTFMVKDIRPGSNSSNPIYLIDKGDGVCYFVADDGSGTALWQSDGTATGTSKIINISIDTTVGIINSGGILYFASTDAAGKELWRSNGQAAGTTRVCDINPGPGSSNPRNFSDVNGILYFTADNGTDGEELYQTNGINCAGTIRVKDIRPGPQGSDIINIKAVNNPQNPGSTLIYFFADSDGTGRRLWKTDGTEAGTVLVWPPLSNTQTLSEVGEITDVNNAVYFRANLGSSPLGADLYRLNPCNTATLTYPSTICVGSGNVNPTLVGPTGGTFSSSSPNLVINNVTGVINANASIIGGPYTVTYTVTENGCVITAQFSVTVVGGVNTVRNVSTLAGNGTQGFTNGVGTAATFNFNPLSTPTGSIIFDGAIGLAFSPSQDTLYVADELNNAVRRIIVKPGPNYGQVTTLAAGFNRPTGVATDALGYIYVADKNNNQIKRVTTTGVVTTIAGQVAGGYQDGPAATALFNQPSDLAIDFIGNIYVADKENHRIRKIAPDGTVSTIAGNNSATFQDGVGTAASFFSPTGIDIDLQGNLYVADRRNHRIRKITPDGTVTTIAGVSASGPLDGPVNTAQLNFPSDVTLDYLGNIYIADRSNNRIRLLANGQVTTYAGDGTGPSGAGTNFADGQASAAKFAYPSGIISDVNGRIYVGDRNNHRVRLITTNNNLGTMGVINGANFVCRGTSGTLTITGYPNEGVNTLALATWQQSTDFGQTWTDIPGTANQATYNYTNIQQTTIFRVMVAQGTCTPTPSNYATVVVSEPTTPTVANPNITICGAGNVTMTATGGSNGTYRWYSVPTGGSPISGSPTTGTYTTFVSANTTFYVAINNGKCESPRVAINVTVLPPITPVITLPSPNIACPGSPVQYTVTAYPGGSYNWSILSGTGTITAGVGTPTITVDWTSGTSGTVQVTVTDANGCTATVNTTANPTNITSPPATPVINLPNPNSVCANSNITYSINAYPPGHTYLWSIPASEGTIVGSATGTSVVVKWNNGASGVVTIQVTDTATGCKSTASNTANPTTVIPSPTPNITPNKPSACLNGEVVYTTPNSSNTFTWSIIGGQGTIVSGQGTNSITVQWTGGTVGTVQLVEANPNCSVTVTNTLPINTPPTTSITPSLTQVCLGNSVNYTVPPIAGATYAWSILNGTGTITGQGTNQITVQWTGGTSGVVQVVVTDANSCSTTASNTSNPTILQSIPTPNIVVPNPNTVCVGVPVTYSTTATGNTFTWSILSGTGNIISGQGTNQITVIWTAPGTDGVVQVQETNSAGCSATVNSNANPTTIQPAGGTLTLTQPNPNQVCQGSTVLYSVNGTGTFNWTISSNGTILSGQGTYQIAVRWDSGTQGIVQVQQTGGSGCPANANNLSNPTIINSPVANSITLPNPNVVCAGGSLTYSVPNAPNHTYNWSIISGVGTITGQGTHQISVQWLAGTQGIVQVVVTNTSTGCSATISNQSQPTTINPIPVATFYLPTPNSVCLGGSLSYSVTNISGATYLWSILNGTGTITGQGTNQISVLWTAGTTGVVQVVITASTGCSTTLNNANNPSTLNPLPTPNITASTSSVCVGIPMTYSTPASANNFTWLILTGTGTITAGQGTNQITVIWTVAGTGTVQVVETGVGPNCSATANNSSSPTTITSSPSLTLIQPNPNQVCPGETATYSVSPAGVYNWTISSNGTILSGQGTESITVRWNSGTQGIVQVQQTGGGCPANANNTANPTVIQSPTTASITVPSPNTVCVGNSVNYSLPNLANHTYVWSILSGTGTITAGAGTNQITVQWTGGTSGVVQAVVTNTATTCAVTVNNSSQPTIIHPAVNQVLTINPTSNQVCRNGTVTYSVGSLAGATYNWSILNGTGDIVGQGTNQITVQWTGGTSGVVQVVITASTGCSQTLSNTNNPTTIHPLPTPTITIPNPNSVCAGVPVTYSVPSSPNLFTWTITSGTGSIISGQGTNSIQVVWTNAGLSTVQLQEVSSAGCSAIVNTNSNPTQVLPNNPTLTINQPNPNQTCPGGTLTYSVTPTGTYTWTVSGNGTILSGQGTNTISVRWNSGTVGQVSVQTTSTSGCPATGNNFSNPTTILSPAVTQITLPNPNSVCVGQSVTYEVPNLPNHTYAWSILSGTGTPTTSTSNQFTVQWTGGTSGIVQVVVTNTGNSCAITLNNNANPTIINTIPNTTLTQPTNNTLCVNNTATYSVGTGFANYVWSISGAAGTINAGQGTNQIIVQWTGTGNGIVSVVVSNTAGCTQTLSNSANPTTIINAPAPAIVGSANACYNSIATYSINPIPGTTYTWSVSGGGAGTSILSGQGTNSITVRWGNVGTAGQVSVIQALTGTTCQGTATLNINLLPVPQPTVSAVVPSQTTVCVNQTASYQSPNVAGHTYLWEVTNGTIASGQGTNVVSINWTTAGTGKVKLTQTHPNGCAVADSLSITIHALPAAPTANNRTTCNGVTSISLIAEEPTAVSYRWYTVPSGGTPIGTGTNTNPYVATGLNPGINTFYVSAVNANNCEGSRTMVTVTVNNTNSEANVTPTITPVQTCNANNTGRIQLTVTGGNPPYTFAWSNGATTKDIENLQAGNYTITITDAGGCTTVRTYNVPTQLKQITDAKIEVLSGQPIVQDTITIFRGESVQLKASATDAVSYLWEPVELADDATSATPTFTPEFTTRIKVTITNDKGCTAEKFINIKVEQFEIFIPNLFTPNNDGKNDRLRVQGTNIQKIEFKVFNRLGEIVYQTNDLVEATQIGWDGTYNGKEAENDNYVWSIKGNFINGQPLKFRGKTSGNVVLMR